MLAKKGLSAAPSAVAQYVEDVFSTYLYTGNGSSQTITNNIDLSGEGGLVWCKARNGAYNNGLFDTNRGVSRWIGSNNTDAEDYSSGNYLTAFNSDGFSIGGGDVCNRNTTTYASWTFRKAEKFFDVVTYTGNGTNKTVSHNLGSVPGCIIVKPVSTAGYWTVYHRELGSNKYVELNTTNQALTNTNVWNNTNPTSTQFSVGTYTDVNKSGETFVAYLFAHDAGGFGDAGDQSVIKCGSFASTNVEADITLGWEPQFIIWKNSTNAANWYIFDTMRGLIVDGGSGTGDNALYANLSNAEAGTYGIDPTPTGFRISAGWGSHTYIYIAIRRGPMKTPEAGTEVFTPAFASSSGNWTAVAGFPVDAVIYKDKSATGDNYTHSRLIGSPYLIPNKTDAEVTTGAAIAWDNQTSFVAVTSGNFSNYINWMFRRAPGFFDVVCYTGNSTSGRVLSHNLGVAPALILTKIRNFSGEDAVASYYNGSTIIGGYWNIADPFSASNAAPSTDITSITSTTYTLNTTDRRVNGAYNYVAYLFASLPGVSKIGSYTGNGSSVSITTDFQPRFVLIKRTDASGGWIIGDSARGLVAGSDPYLLLNSSAAEDTDEDWVDITSTSFTVNQTTAANANVNTGTYIYLAIA